MGKPLPTIFALSTLFIVSWFLYAPGLSGPFLFDDYPNLSPIGSLGRIDNSELFWAYLKSGFSGPTGRPFSLATFVLNAQDWPTDPRPFKQTNVIIHMLVGLFLFLSTKGILRSTSYSDRDAAIVALLTAAFWLFNPFLVSTTLYVVQRMAQLSTLFVIIGIWGYLLGRQMLPDRPSSGYAVMTTSIVTCTLLATISKENGILLPPLVLAIEYFFRERWLSKGPRIAWRVPFLWIPSAVIFVYLALQVAGPAELPNRDFTLWERVLSQPRFLWDYLYKLLVPHIQTQGLYQDGRIVSKGFFEPITTGLAILALLGAFIFAILARKTIPLLGFAVVFFFVAHSLESSTIGLELYFEHRNYLPALFLFLPVAAALLWLRRFVRTTIWIFIVVLSLAPYAFATHQRATLWGEEAQLFLVWADSNPNSARAQVAAAHTLTNLGEVTLAKERIRHALIDRPSSGLLLVTQLVMELERGELDPMAFNASLEMVLDSTLDAQVLKGLELIVDTLIEKEKGWGFASLMIARLENFMGGEDDQNLRRQRLGTYLQGRLFSSSGNAGEAYDRFESAVELYQSTEAGLKMVSILAEDSHYEEALRLLANTSGVFGNESKSGLYRSHATYQKEIERLRTLIVEAMTER